MKGTEKYIVHLLVKKHSSFDELSSVLNSSPIEIASTLKNLEDEKVIQSLWRKEYTKKKKNHCHLKKSYTVSNKKVLRNHQTSCSDIGLVGGR